MARGASTSTARNIAWSGVAISSSQGKRPARSDSVEPQCATNSGQSIEDLAYSAPKMATDSSGGVESVWKTTQ